MIDEITKRRLSKVLLPAVRAYQPGSAIIYDSIYEFFKNYCEMYLFFGPFKKLFELLNVKKLDDNIFEAIHHISKEFESEIIRKIDEALKEKSQ